MMMQKGVIRIAHVVYSFDAIGGLENGLINLINNLDSDRFFHVVCSLTVLGDIQSRVRNDNITCYALSKCDGNDLRVPFKLWKLFRQEKIDVVHLRNWATMVEGYVAARLANIPRVIYSEHGRHFEDVWETKRIRSVIHRYILNHVDVPLCVSGEVAVEMHGLYRMKQDVKVILNGVDTEIFKPVSGKYLPNGQVHQGLVVGTVARLDRGKLLDQLIVDFMAGCVADKLVIVGDGPEKEKLDELVDRYKWRERINLAGHLDDIPKVLNSFDIFVLSSASEGLSNVLLEAMSCGLPVVAYDVGGNRELIDSERGGYLVPFGKDGEFINAVNSLLSEKNKIGEMGAYNRQKAVECFSINIMTKSYSDLYYYINLLPSWK